MSEYTVFKARKYEKEHKSQVSLDERPEFHVTGQIGWINDPNGFSLYKNQYHLFFQYHPYSTFWGPMHWGHVKSDDFIKWEELPVAIAPDQEYDGVGCFSGSAVELDDGRQLLVYTGVSRINKDEKDIDIQQQCLAVGDGTNYEKISNNPVITTDMIPSGNSKLDFRDPKIWKENGKYYLVAGNRSADGSGDILLYESDDAFKWKFCETIDKCENKYGKMWECPDFFELDGNEVLLVSPQDMEASEPEFHAGNGTLVLLGHKGENKRFVRESIRTVDYGLDFYAPQTLLTKDGRRVMIAWMQNWDTCNQNHEERNIYGQMTIPRELEIRNGRLCQMPVREIAKYYDEEYIYTAEPGSADVSFDGVKGRVFDMTVDIEKCGDSGNGEFTLKLAKSDKYETNLNINVLKETMTFDRSRSGGRRDIVSTRVCKIDQKDGKVSIRILMDHNGVEVFANNGEQTMSSMIYTPMKGDNICFCLSENISARVEFHKIKTR